MKIYRGKMIFIFPILTYNLIIFPIAIEVLQIHSI